MGDLMPDAVLAGIVARGIDEAFFKKQMRPGRNQWEAQQPYPSWLVEFVEKEAEKQTKAAVQKWIAENQQKVAEIIASSLAGGLSSSVARAVDSIFQGEFMKFKDGLSQTIRNLMQ